MFSIAQTDVTQLTYEINDAFVNVVGDLHNLSGVLDGIRSLNAKGVNTGDAEFSLQTQIVTHSTLLDGYVLQLTTMRDELSALAAQIDDDIGVAVDDTAFVDAADSAVEAPVAEPVAAAGDPAAEGATEPAASDPAADPAAGDPAAEAATEPAATEPVAEPATEEPAATEPLV